MPRLHICHRRPAGSGWCRSRPRCAARCWTGRPNGVGFSHIVGIGGNTDIGFGSVLDWLSRDAGTGAILLDIRRLKDRRAFLSAARAASRLRPVVAIRRRQPAAIPPARRTRIRGSAAPCRRAERHPAGGSARRGGDPVARPSGAQRRAGHRQQRDQRRPHGGRCRIARRPASGADERSDDGIRHVEPDAAHRWPPG